MFAAVDRLSRQSRFRYILSVGFDLPLTSRHKAEKATPCSSGAADFILAEW